MTITSLENTFQFEKAYEQMRKANHIATFMWDEKKGIQVLVQRFVLFKSIKRHRLNYMEFLFALHKTYTAGLFATEKKKKKKK